MLLVVHTGLIKQFIVVLSKFKFSAGNSQADPANRLNLENVIDESSATITSANCYKYYMNIYVYETFRNLISMSFLFIHVYTHMYVCIT